MSTKQESRSKITGKNILVGIISQFLVLFISFFSRTVFINTLGAQYLGINGLFGNILSILSLAELGLGNVVIYSLYKPLALNDTDKINRLVNYFSKLYNQIAGIVFVIGIILVPFLHVFVSTELNRGDVILYYLLFLINSVVSYLLTHKMMLINADQKKYITKSYTTLFLIIKEILQVLILIFTRNYKLFLIIQILTTFFTNYSLHVYANRHYKFLNSELLISEKDKKVLKNNIKATFFYKIGMVIMNNTDNILISSLVGTIYVGFYSNYTMIVNAIETFINVLIQGIISSIGNLGTSKNNERAIEVFNLLLLFFHWLSIFCALCFIFIFNDFITIWIGFDYTLDMLAVYAIAFSFYIKEIINPVWMYREAYGLFDKVKNIMLVASLINLFLSLILGSIMGLPGILFATGLSRILSTVWFEPNILFKYVLKISVFEYWKRQFLYIMLSILSYFIINFVINAFPVGLTFIFIKIFIIFMITFLLFFIAKIRSREVKSISGILKTILKNTKAE